MSQSKDGHSYMAGVKLIRKIEDIPDLKNALIELSNHKTHIEMSRYAQKLAKHILDISHIESTHAFEECIEINHKWQIVEAKFPEARQISFKMNRMALEAKDPIEIKVIRAMGQIAAVPHVKWHALIASDYAITIINLLYPHNMSEVKKEREFQIKSLMEQ